MAENDKAKAAKSDPTQRVVLKRERVIIIPDSIDPAKIGEAAKALGIKGKLPESRAVEAEAWVVVGSGVGSKTQAIEAVAGKPGTPDAQIGAFKAPNVSSWSGGEQYDAPPLPLVQRRPLEESA